MDFTLLGNKTKRLWVGRGYGSQCNNIWGGGSSDLEKTNNSRNKIWRVSEEEK